MAVKLGRWNDSWPQANVTASRNSNSDFKIRRRMWQGSKSCESVTFTVTANLTNDSMTLVIENWSSRWACSFSKKDFADGRIFELSSHFRRTIGKYFINLQKISTCQWRIAICEIRPKKLLMAISSNFCKFRKSMLSRKDFDWRDEMRELLPSLTREYPFKQID